MAALGCAPIRAPRCGAPGLRRGAALRSSARRIAPPPRAAASSPGGSSGAESRFESCDDGAARRATGSAAETRRPPPPPLPPPPRRVPPPPPPPGRGALRGGARTLLHVAGGMLLGAALSQTGMLLRRPPPQALPPPVATVLVDLRGATRDAAVAATARAARSKDASAARVQAAARGGDTRRKMNSFVREAAESVGPSVVRLDVDRGAEARPHLFRLWMDEPAEGAPSRERGQGSGVVVDGARGHILTNAHVVNGATAMRVTFTDGRTFEARLLGSDDVTDLALLAVVPPRSPAGAAVEDVADAIAALALPQAPLGDSRCLDVGDWVVAVGNPVGLDSSVTLGIVSALRRSAAEVGIPDKRLDFIQTDAAINPGNSGGPLVNEFGEVVGISTAIRADAEGIGFAIPINTAKGVAAALAEGRPVQHPYLGIQMATQLASSGAEIGVRVVGVVPGSPAEAAGLRPGDVVASCGGAATRSARALQAAVEGARVGVALELRVRRGGEEASLQVTPEDVAQRRPGRAAQRQPGDDEPGASTTPAPAAQPGSRARYGAPPMPGAGGGYRGL